MPRAIEAFTLGSLVDRLRTYPPDARIKAFVFSLFGDAGSQVLDVEPDGTPADEIADALGCEDPDTPVKAAVFAVVIDGEMTAEWYTPIHGGTDAGNDAN